MTEFGEFRKEIKRIYSGKRERVVSAKISPRLHREILSVLEERHYKTMNDFIEEALLDKIARIEWAKANAEGVKYGS